MYQNLENIFSRPDPYQFYTAADLWTDDYTSQKMLEFHLNEAIDVSSRNHKFIARSVEWIVKHFNLNENSRVIDFGCGPGLYTTRLAEKGLQVSGVDFSKRSMEYAKNTASEKNLQVNYYNQNYLEFESDEQFDLITMIMCDFCALSPQQRKIMLQKFGKLLKPGGSILLDVYSLAAFEERRENAICEVNLLGGFWSPEKYYGFMNTFKYDDVKVMLDKFSIIEPNRTRTVYNWLQYFNKEKLTAEFDQNGLKVTELYSNVAGDEFKSDGKEFAVVAKKSI